MRYRCIAIVIACFLVTGSVWGAWNVETGVGPSQTTNAFAITAFITTDGNKKVTEDRCNQVSVLREYNGNTTGMQSLSATNNVWYSIVPYQTNGTVTVTASGSCPNSADDGATASHKIEAGSPMQTTSIQNDVSQELPRGSTIPLNITVSTANPDTNFDPGINITYTIFQQDTELQHGSITSNAYQEDSGTYVKNITLPDQAGTHLLWVSANTTGTQKANGDAAVLNLADNMQGFVNISSKEDTCNPEMTQCEIGSHLLVNFTEDVGNANNGTLLLKNANTGNVVRNTSMQERTNATWSGNITTPHNVSAIDVEVQMRNNITTFTTADTLDLVPFNSNILSRTSLSPGNSFSIELELFRPFTNTVLKRTDVQTINISIVNQSTGNTTTQYTLDELQHKNGLFSIQHTISQDAAEGQWRIAATIQDQYGNIRQRNKSFTVSRQTQSGALQIAPQSFTKTFNSSGVFTEQLKLNNTGTSSLAVHLFSQGNISDILTGENLVHAEENRSGLFLMQSEEVVNKELRYNITTATNAFYSGSLVVRVLTDLDDNTEEFRASLPVTVQPQLRLENDSIAAMPKQVNVNVTKATTFDRNITIISLSDNETDVTLSVSGSVADIASVGQNTVSLEANGENTVQLTVDIQSSTPNNLYTGSVVLTAGNDTVQLPVSIEVDKEKTQGNISVQVANRDLGTVVKGGTVTRQMQIENTGSVSVTNIQAFPTSQNTRIVQLENISQVELSPGDTITRSLQLKTSKIPASSFSDFKITVRGSNDAQANVRLSITVVEDFGTKFNQLQNTLDDLRSQAQEKNVNISTDVEELEGLIQDGKDAFSQDQYDSAKQTYSKAKGIKQDIENTIDQAAEPDDNETTTNPGNGSEGGSGPPILLFLIIFVLLLAIGVVLYLSIIPE